MPEGIASLGIEALFFGLSFDLVKSLVKTQGFFGKPRPFGSFRDRLELAPSVCIAVDTPRKRSPNGVNLRININKLS